MRHGRGEDLIQQTAAFVLAGGEGQRLHPLTRDRAKPAVPFGGHYRVIDFTLSNCLNSGLRRIHVLTQYKSLSLDRHLQMGWNIFSRELGEFLDVIPPQQRTSSGFYRGTADAIFQNIYTLERERPGLVLVLSGDHIYRMDYLDLLREHVRREAELTVSCMPVPREYTHLLGVMETDADGRVVRFLEKPSAPPSMPGRPGEFLASMGVYVFKTETLVRRVCDDAKRKSTHDFARDVIPSMLGRDRVFAYPFREPGRAAARRTTSSRYERRRDAAGPDRAAGTGRGASRPPYWRDIGTVDAYYEANVDLTSGEPLFDLYDVRWPVRTYHEQRPPARFVSEGVGAPRAGAGRTGSAADSIVASGCVIAGGSVERSILSAGVVVRAGSRVEDSILLEDVEVGRGAVVRRAIVDKGVRIPEHAEIGVDPAADRRRFTVSPGGVVVVPKEMQLV